MIEQFHQSRHTPELRQNVMELWIRSELPSSSIAKQFGMTRGGVSGMTHRYMQQRGFPSRAHLQAQCHALPPVDWWVDGPRCAHDSLTTPVKAHPLALKTNKGNGLLPRNAVKVKARQQGQGQSHQRPTIAPGPRSRKELSANAEASKQIAADLREQLSTEFIAAQELRANQSVFSDPVPGEPCTILDLRHDTCRAVLGEHSRLPGGMYCGSKIHKGAYCLTHLLVYRTTKYVEPEQVKDNPG